ncbi:hypothetical protein BN1080_03099 [Planococcus massiliensis]|uniref:Uncharacterized protein n=1 Tax=Planococcus massiliensis TaxID=1499687 RepID=A0A098EQM2_9BACL|nr:hypothetical protein [Planococcus massiliensis]CEG24080.1 hypothetical protein BN1080_03099 [Planococcus massiliensis]
MTRKNLANGIVLAFTVILVRFIDVKIYDMHLIVNVLVIVGLIAGLMKLLNRFPSLEKPVGKKSAMAINFIVVISIFLVFFIFGL